MYNSCDNASGTSPSRKVYLLHWVNSILTYCRRFPGGFPRIKFVATHKDKIVKAKVETHRQKLVESIRSLFKSHGGLEHLEFDPLVFIDATNKNDKEILTLRQLLIDRAFGHPRWGEKMPTAWVPLELQLVEQAERGHKIISRQDLCELNTKNEPLNLNNEQLETFLKVQHSLGKLLYFDDANLRDFIIISPDYLVEVLKSFVTEKQFWPKKGLYRDVLENLHSKGLVKRADIFLLWEQDQFRHILPYKDFMISMLVHMDILITPCSVSELTIPQTKAEDFLVPCMIDFPHQTDYLKENCKQATTLIMAYSFIEEVIPPAMVYRFLGSLISMWSLKEYRGHTMLYSDLAVVQVDDHHDIVVQVNKKRIVVLLVHAESKTKIEPTLASSIQECLTSSVLRISEFYTSLSGDGHTQTDVTKDNTDNISLIVPFDIEVGVVCKGLFGKQSLCFLSHKDLPEARTKDQWKCTIHKRKHNINSLFLWFAEKLPAENCAPLCQGLGRMEMEQTPSDKHLIRIAQLLDFRMCHHLILVLGLATKVWTQTLDTYRDSKTCVFMALVKWKQSKTNPTFSQLKFALSECETDEHILCQVFRDISVDTSGFSDDLLKKTPSTKSLLRLSNHIGDSSMHLGIELDIDISEMQEIQYKYDRKLLEQTKEILSRWQKRSKPKPTVLQLIKALHRIGKNHFLKDIKF